MAHDNLGVVLNELGEHKKAVSFCQKAIQINPNYVSGHNNLGEIFRNLKEFQKAADCFKMVDKPLSKAQFLECVYLSNGLENYNKLSNNYATFINHNNIIFNPHAYGYWLSIFCSTRNSFDDYWIIDNFTYVFFTIL